MARTKARVATRNMAMSTPEKLDKMDVIELARENPGLSSISWKPRTPGKYIFETKDLVIGYDEPLSRPEPVDGRGQKIVLVGRQRHRQDHAVKEHPGPYPGPERQCGTGRLSVHRLL